MSAAITPADVSVVIPTLNAAGILPQCLSAIRRQQGGDKIEIVIADGGSTDGTIEVARRFGAHVVPNPLKTGEAGKAAGARAATGTILAFIDSDNILPDDDWMIRMLAPFHHPEIIAAEPLYYTYRKTDFPITRYCAILGMNDPLCLYLGTYDRYSEFTDQWTGLPIDTEDLGDYLVMDLDHLPIPTIGANGFFIRHQAIEPILKQDYLFDVDLLPVLIDQHGSVRIAKVKTGVIHIYGRTLFDFFGKQRRRIQDYLFFKDRRTAQPVSFKIRLRLIWFCLYALAFIPNFIWAGLVFGKRRDFTVFFHPIACFATLLIYGFGCMKCMWGGASEHNRSNWRQVSG